MSSFKEDLKEELRRDAAFTEEIKQRILQQARPARKRIRYQIPIITMTLLAAAILFVLMNINNNKIGPTVKALPDNPADLIKVLQENEEVLPYQKEATGKEKVILPDVSYMHGRQQLFAGLPMIVEPSISYEVGEYAMLDIAGETVMAQVVGSKGDKVKYTKGQVYLNGELLTLPGMIGAVEVSEEEQALFDYRYFDYYYDGYEQEYADQFINRVAENEVVVLNGNGIEKVKIEDAAGKVVAIQHIQPSFLLTEDETAVYERFKEQHNLEVLRGVEPFAIAKMYIISSIEGDIETNYALLTDREESIVWSREEHDDVMTRDDLNFSSVEKEMNYAYTFNGIEQGRLIEREEGEGAIEFISKYRPNEPPMIFQLLQNDDGIWQVAFMPIQ